MLFAAMTLLQAIRRTSSGVEIPGIYVRDYPDFEFRAAADWILNGEVNRWSMDRAQGIEAISRPHQAQVDLRTPLQDQYGAHRRFRVGPRNSAFPVRRTDARSQPLRPSARHPPALRQATAPATASPTRPDPFTRRAPTSAKSSRIASRIPMAPTTSAWASTAARRASTPASSVAAAPTKS